MKAKFKNEKIKTYLTTGAIVLGFAASIFALSSLFEDENKKTSQQTQLPTFKYDNSRDTEVKTFRKEYGKQLTEVETDNKELRKEMDNIKKTVELQKKSELKYGGYNPDDINYPKEPISGGLIPPPAPSPSNTNNQRINNGFTNLQPPKEEIKPVVTVETGMISIKKYETANINTKKNKDELAQKIKSEDEEKKKKKLHIPAGAILSGFLLNGLDAPTGGKAKNQPHPVLIEITDLGILPNEFTVDMQGCFAVGSAYGDLASERAYVRIENISCIKKDGTPIEAAKNTNSSLGFVAGEDGKVGLFGRVVSKQGTMLARTLVAGFLEGAAKAFNQSNTFVSTSGTGAVQSFDPSKAGDTAMFSGAAEASKKLADFYMKLVNEMFPVIEINAKRKVDVLLHVAVDLEYGVKNNMTTATGQNKNIQSEATPIEKNNPQQNIQGILK